MATDSAFSGVLAERTDLWSTLRRSRPGRPGPGLGAYAYAEFGIPVIGVARSASRTATHAVPVWHGTCARPLFVAAATGRSRRL
jgi:hypothetical protein